MFTLSKKLSLAAVGGLIVLGGYGLPARAGDITQVLGPVGPNDPIVTTVASSPFTRQTAAIAACTS